MSPDVTPIFKNAHRHKRSKAKRDAQELRAARLVLLERTGGRCEGKGFSTLCTGVGTEAHHIVRRSQGGTNDPGDLAWLCFACHRAVHDNPARALVEGLLRPGGAA